MKELLNIINQIQGTSSRNDKERLFEQFKNNELFKAVLKFVYDPYIVTGLSTKKINKKAKGNATITLNALEEVIEYLRENNTGRDSDILIIQDFISRQDAEVQELVKQIVTKSLKIGATANTMNKVYGEGFILTFGCMLAEKLHEHTNHVEGKEFIITPKLDGNRVIAIKEDSNVSMFTRQGQTYEGLIDIEEELKKLPNGVYDGEFIAENPNGLNSADLYRVTTSIVRKDGIKKGIEFHIFDGMSVEEFKSGESKLPYSKRKEMLSGMIAVNGFRWLKEVPVLYKGKDTSVIPGLLDKITSEGGEGLMLNIADAGYVTKRTRDILKIKKMQTCDCEIIGFEEGEGRNTGVLGAIIINYKGNSVKVGSGYSDGDRSYIWQHREELLGRVIEVQYFEESKNKDDDSLSLRFPVFKCIRELGKEVSYF